MLDALAALAVRAGREIVEIRRVGCAAMRKPDGSIVTAADQVAEEIILKGLAEIAPGVPVVAEEAVSAGQETQHGGTFFLVDPLDGTRDFIETERGEYAVNIALLENGRPVLGVIYAPAFDDLHVGGPEGAWRTLKGQRLALQPPAEDRHELIAVTSRRSKNVPLDLFIAGAAPGGRWYSSSAIKFARMVDGAADLYPRFSPVSEWDIAAGDALLRAVGGGVMDLHGEPLRYGQKTRGFLVDGFIAYAHPRAKDAALAQMARKASA